MPQEIPGVSNTLTVIWERLNTLNVHRIILETMMMEFNGLAISIVEFISIEQKINLQHGHKSNFNIIEYVSKRNNGNE